MTPPNWAEQVVAVATAVLALGVIGAAAAAVFGPSRCARRAGGPLFYRLLITGGPIDQSLAEGVVELILRGFAPDHENEGIS